MHGGFTSAPSPPSPKTKMPRPTIVDRNYIWAFLNLRQCGEKIGHGKVCCKKKIRWNKGVSVHSVSFPPYGIGQFSTISWIISGWFEILIQGGQKFNSVGKLNLIGKGKYNQVHLGPVGIVLLLLLFFWWLAPWCYSVCPGECSGLWTTLSQLFVAIFVFTFLILCFVLLFLNVHFFTFFFFKRFLSLYFTFLILFVRVYFFCLFFFIYFNVIHIFSFLFSSFFCDIHLCST